MISGTIGLNVPALGKIPCPRWSGSARAGCPEHQRVVILAGGGPDVRRVRHVRRLCFTFGRRLHGRHPSSRSSSRASPTISRVSRDVIVAFEMRRREIAARQRLGMFAFELPLTSRRFSSVAALRGGGAPSKTNTSRSVLGDEPRRSGRTARRDAR